MQQSRPIVSVAGLRTASGVFCHGNPPSGHVSGSESIGMRAGTGESKMRIYQVSALICQESVESAPTATEPEWERKGGWKSPVAVITVEKGLQPRIGKRNGFQAVP